MNTDFTQRIPACFKEFRLEDTEAPPKGIEFVSKNIVCRCSNANLNIYTSLGNGMPLAPVSIECPRCGYKEEIFNPEIHGWDGQNGDNSSMVGTKPLRVIEGCPARVRTDYSYQGLENYQDLADEGVVNMEDYFDTINIYAVNKGGEIFESIDYECA